MIELLPVLNNREVRFIDAREHVDNQFVNKSSLTVFEEMPIGQLEILKDGIHYLCLHLRRDLLIEIEFFDYQVEIIKESIMHVGFNVAVEIWRDVVRFVRSFNFLDPNVKET